MCQGLYNKCYSCVELQEELLRTKFELESAKEIIRILEEDRKLYSSALSMPRPNSYSPVTNEWVQVRKASKGNRSAQNQNITVSNRFAPLQSVQQRITKMKPEERRMKPEDRRVKPEKKNFS